jgi:hypothetical protein
LREVMIRITVTRCGCQRAIASNVDLTHHATHAQR